MSSRWKKELDGGCESELRVRCMSDKWATFRFAHQIHLGQRELRIRYMSESWAIELSIRYKLDRRAMTELSQVDMSPMSEG